MDWFAQCAHKHSLQKHMQTKSWPILTVTLLRSGVSMLGDINCSDKDFWKKCKNRNKCSNYLNEEKKTTQCSVWFTAWTVIIIIYPLTTRIIGAPQMILQPVSSILQCSPLPSGTWQTPGLSIPWRCLPTSSSVCLVFFPLSLCLARWFWPDLMNGRHEYTTAVCVSLRWSGLRGVQLPAGSCTDFLVGNMVS